ncbi:MAG: amidophosphoribosyltransferase, partial [Proteobacteria bacterium]|nr:amidophosphoribosyltransferase [Pseudomonadota bacterium]
IDISNRAELIAATHSTEEICKYIDADSLAYLSVEGMLEVVPERNCQCTACFTGVYPTEIPEKFCKEQFSVDHKDKQKNS